MVAPDAFGIMLLISATLEGAELLTDVGSWPFVQSSPRGDEPAFIETIWTVQLVRGALLAVLLVAAAPALAEVFSKPELTGMLRLAALAPLLDGLVSLRSIQYVRRLDFVRPVVVRTGQQLVSIGATLASVALVPSALGMLMGYLVGRGFRLFATFAFFEGHAPRLRWEKGAVREAFGFGGWVMGSSALTLLETHGDRYVLGATLDATALGIFSVARKLAQLLPGIFEQVSRSMMLPIYGNLIRATDDPAELKMPRLRWGLEFGAMAGAGVMCGGAHLIVDVLYQDVYREAGSYLTVLGVLCAIQIQSETQTSLLLARGDSRAIFHRSALRAALLVVGLPLGGSLGGVYGILFALVIASALSTVVLSWALRGHQLLRLKGMGVAWLSFLVFAFASRWGSRLWLGA